MALYIRPCQGKNEIVVIATDCKWSHKCYYVYPMKLKQSLTDSPWCSEWIDVDFELKNANNSRVLDLLLIACVLFPSSFYAMRAGC